MFSGDGSLAGGKKIMTKLSTKHISERMLIASPYRPREKWDFTSGRPLMRSRAIEPMEIMYEDSRATVPRAVSWLKAIVEPKEMLTRRIEMTVVASTAFRGMSQPGRTYEEQKVLEYKWSYIMILWKN